MLVANWCKSWLYVLLEFLLFFFKQKTAYEIMPSLVGSEMCIRDRYMLGHAESILPPVWKKRSASIQLLRSAYRVPASASSATRKLVFYVTAKSTPGSNLKPCWLPAAPAKNSLPSKAIPCPACTVPVHFKPWSIVI